MDEKQQQALLKYTETADMIGAGCVMIGYYLEFSSKPFGQILLIIGFGTLAASSFLKMNPRLKQSGEDASEVFLQKLIFITACVGMMASLFKIMHWPNAHHMFYAFFPAAGVILIASVVKSKTPWILYLSTNF